MGGSQTDRGRDALHGAPVYIELVYERDRSLGYSGKLFRRPVGHHGAPLRDRNHADPERPSDSGPRPLKMSESLRLKHGPSLTPVRRITQPQSKRGRVTLVSMDLLATFSERLIDAMKEAGVNATELADACGVSSAAVSKWMSGATKNLTADNSAAVARSLGVREEWLRTGRLPRERQHGEEERGVEKVLRLLEELKEPLAAVATAINELSELRGSPKQRSKKN